MKEKMFKLFGILLYFIILSLLFDYNWVKIFQIKPMFSVFIGIIILTVTQYKKKLKFVEIAYSLKWNALLSGVLATLVSLLSVASSTNLNGADINTYVEKLLPIIYGSIIFLVVNSLLEKHEREVHKEEKEEVNIDLMSSELAYLVFNDYKLTNREGHVALKLLEGITNKEIGEQLYISEATVKKHIQNLFQKFEVNSRGDFKEKYIEAAKNIKTN